MGSLFGSILYNNPKAYLFQSLLLLRSEMFLISNF